MWPRGRKRGKGQESWYFRYFYKSRYGVSKSQPNIGVQFWPIWRFKKSIASGNPAMRAAQSPGSKAVKSTAEQPAQGSISPLAAVSSPKSVNSGGNPRGVTSLSIEVIESGSGKAKTTARKTPSPGKSTVVSPVPPPPKYTSRKRQVQERLVARSYSNIHH